MYLKDDLKPVPAASTPAAPNRSALEPNTNLKDFEGRFYNEELDTAYNSTIVNGKLFLSHIRLGDIELADAGKNKFSGRIAFPVEVEFVRNKNKQITGFRISNWGAKNVKFDKVNNRV